MSITRTCRNRARLVALIATLTSALPLGSVAEASAALTVPATADTRLSESSPSSRYGTATTLRTDYESSASIRSYLRFAVTNAGAVSTAKLRVFATAQGAEPALYAVADTTWSESAVTWSTRPALGSLLSQGPEKVLAGSYAEFDVSALVRGDGVYSFALVAGPDDTDGVWYESREATGGHPPQLVLTSEGPPSPIDPTPTPGPTPTPEPTPAPGGGTIFTPPTAVVETQPVPHTGDAADDSAIWIDRSDPSRSTIVGTDKQGGLAVYDLAGRELHYYADSKPNNVDLRYGFSLGGEQVALVATSDRSRSAIRLYVVDAATRGLRYVAARQISVGIGIYGLCMYRSPASGRFYVFDTDRSSGTVQQWELFDAGAGQVDARLVRQLSVGSLTEGCVADDESRGLFISEEDVGIWKYGAEPGDGSSRTAVDRVASAGGHLSPDVEGLAIYHTTGGQGYLLASSQGNDRFAVYQRTAPHAWLRTFEITGGAIDGVTTTDGIEVTNAALSSIFPSGMFVAQDNSDESGRQNFKLVPWERIATAADPLLAIDTIWRPFGL